MRESVRPFLKWAGGKTQLIEKLMSHAPPTYGKYIEPFIGGGALFFHLQPQNAVIADSNPELINCYLVVRDCVEELIWTLSHYPHEKKFYYTIRQQNPDDMATIARAARFIYLNKTCYNGLYRVNKKGQFNVPFGSQKNPKICDPEQLKAASHALKNTQIELGDYRDILKKFAQPSDFVFLDPPYQPIGGHSDFKRYTKEFFYEDNQRQLAHEFEQLVKTGVYCILTNSNVPLIREFYEKFQYEIVDTKRNINSDGGKRVGQDLIVFATEVAPQKPKSKRPIGQANALIENFPGTRFMGSKYNILDFIDSSTSNLHYSSVLDAFSGSGCVSYLFKTKGKQVYSNDLLEFSYHTTHALVANNNVVLTNDDIEMLLTPNCGAPTFIQDTFQGLYYSDSENAFLDEVRTNIERLENPYKKSLALSALVRACFKKRPRGLFSYVGERYNDNRMDMRRSLREHFVIAVQEFNSAVFDNARANFSYNCDIFDLDVTPDLVYMDPPYYSPHADSDYLRRYHFVEGLVKYWRGVKIQPHTKTKKFVKYPTPFDGKNATYAAFPKIFEKFRNSIIVVSYSSNSLPSKSELVDMLKAYKRSVTVLQTSHKYSFGTQHEGRKANDVQEYIFIGV